MEEATEEVEAWCRESNMSLSTGLCTTSIFGDDQDVEVAVAGEKLKRVQQAKLLGIVFSEEQD